MPSHANLSYQSYWACHYSPESIAADLQLLAKRDAVFEYVLAIYLLNLCVGFKSAPSFICINSPFTRSSMMVAMTEMTDGLPMLHNTCVARARIKSPTSTA